MNLHAIFKAKKEKLVAKESEVIVDLFDPIVASVEQKILEEIERISSVDEMSSYLSVRFKEKMKTNSSISYNSLAILKDKVDKEMIKLGFKNYALEVKKEYTTGMINTYIIVSIRIPIEEFENT